MRRKPILLTLLVLLLVLPQALWAQYIGDRDLIKTSLPATFEQMRSVLRPNVINPQDFKSSYRTSDDSAWAQMIVAINKSSNTGPLTIWVTQPWSLDDDHTIPAFTAGGSTYPVGMLITSGSITVGSGATLTINCGVIMPATGVITGSGTVTYGAAAPIISADLVDLYVATGSDTSIRLRDADVAHGMTTVSLTSTWAYVKELSSTAGGLLLYGISDADAQAMKLVGIMGSTDPTDATPAVSVVAQKKNGTGVQALAAAETVFQVANNTTALLTVNGGGDTKLADGAFATAVETVTTLGAAATTFAVDSNICIITGDGGGNTVGTITGGVTGQTLYLLFTDANVTITDTDAHTANTVGLSAAFTGADDTVLTLLFDGTSWYEVARSVN